MPLGSLVFFKINIKNVCDDVGFVLFKYGTLSSHLYTMRLKKKKEAKKR